MAARSKRIVLKFGTGILTRPSGHALDQVQFRRLTSEVAQLVKAGHECVVVSSGAVGAGMMRLGISQRPKDLPTMQACAAVGQSRLMRLYDSLFAKHGLGVAQLLLTHQDIDSRSRYTNARNTLECLFRCGNVVPIINENDPVAVEEIRFGDNDKLSAEVAIMVGADTLILLTSVDGLLHRTATSERLVPVVRDVDSVLGYATATKGRLSVGGMVSKLQAVKSAVTAGVETVIANGRTPGVLLAAALAAKDTRVGTRFLVPKPSGLRKR